MSAARVATTLARLADRNRGAADLALLASLAVRVEPQLLRRLRLRFLPGADAAAEADLWFSALIAARDSTSCTWTAGAAESLRAELKRRWDEPPADPRQLRVNPAQVRAEIAAAHRIAWPLIHLEEELVWLALDGAPAASLERELGRAVRTLGDQPGAADDLAAWAIHALPDLPKAARATAAAWQLGLAAASRFAVGPALATAPPPDLLAHVARNVLVDRGRARLRIVREAGALWIEPAPGASDRDADTLEVPLTHPLWLEVSSRDGRRAVIEIGAERAQLEARHGDVLRNALGEAWTLEEQGLVPVGADEDAGSEHELGWLIVRLPDDLDGWASVREPVLADLARAATRLERVDVVIVLAPSLDAAGFHTISEDLSLASGQTLRRALYVSPNPERALFPDSEDAAAPHSTEIGRRRQIRTVMRAHDGDSAWPPFKDAVSRAIERSSSQSSPLVVVVGRDACALAERRYQSGAPALLVFDDVTPWAPPAPALRASMPAALWSGDAATPSAAYVLGAVRTGVTYQSRTGGLIWLAEIQRTLRDGAWHERIARSASVPMPYEGDPSFGWADRDVAAVVGDRGHRGFDAFVDALRGRLVDDGGMNPQAFVVIGDHEEMAVFDRRLHDSGDSLRVWLFITDSAAAAKLGEDLLELIAPRNAANAVDEVVGFIDETPLVSEGRFSERQAIWIATPEESSRLEGTSVAFAGLEALLGAARVTDGIPYAAVERHLTARYPDGVMFVRRNPRAIMAPALKHVRIDLSALRRVPGGRARGAPAIAGGDRGRVVLVIGASERSRSAWIDRWLTATAETSEDRATAGGPVLGWSPSIESFGAALDRARALLLPWSTPYAAGVGELDGPGELAWRIEGANALYVVDGLGDPPTGDEVGLVEACARNRAGRLLVASNFLPANRTGIHVVDLDTIPLPDELSALGRGAFEPSIAAWVDELATWGHDQPLLVAGELVKAILGGEGPRPGGRALRHLSSASRAVMDGDTETLLANVRDLIALASETLGADETASLVGRLPAPEPAANVPPQLAEDAPQLADDPVVARELRLLHLSHLQFATEEDAVTVYGQLAADLRELDVDELDALVVSGDLASRAKPAEYEMVRQFLHHMMAEFRLTPEQVTLVPGNHDADWSQVEPTYNLGDAVDVEKYERYLARFQAFAALYQSVKGREYPLAPGEQGTLDVHRELQILGLNTAWAIDARHPDRASIHLEMLEVALSRLTPKRPGELRIAVVHHEPRGERDDEVMKRLDEHGFLLVLHGRAHVDRAFVRGLPPILVAGGYLGSARASSSEVGRSYNLLRIGIHRITVERRARDPRSGLWVPGELSPIHIERRSRVAP